jgi:hypothetical protein
MKWLGILLVASTAFAETELVAFVPPKVGPNHKYYLTGSGVPMVDPTIPLPVYANNPPPRPYDVLGYVRVSNQPKGEEPRKKALQSAARCGKRHGGDALYMVLPDWGEYMIAAVLKWK